jgi:hypothetical protein
MTFINNSFGTQLSYSDKGNQNYCSGGFKLQEAIRTLPIILLTNKTYG